MQFMHDAFKVLDLDKNDYKGSIQKIKTTHPNTNLLV